MRRPMSAREREHGELPSPIWSLSDRKVRQGLYVFKQLRQHLIFSDQGHSTEVVCLHDSGWVVGRVESDQRDNCDRLPEFGLRRPLRSIRNLMFSTVQLVPG